ncbi:MAG: alpha/beta fold hydrolase [Acidimicrobiia bacterium]
MTTFALIHGAWHGAWCWDPLIPELERRGHRAVAVDLPCDDPAATTMDNAKLVTDALSNAGAGADDGVAVVGHSLGGITAAVVPLLRPVRRVVFLCALIPRPGRSFGEVMTSEPNATTEEFNAVPRHVGEGGSVTFDPAVVGPFFYQACPPETLASAASRLRSQVWTTTRETCPLDKWPDCELVTIICNDDEVVTPAWSRHLARDVLHVDPIELAGGHFPMIAIPSQLADTLTSEGGSAEHGSR